MNLAGLAAITRHAVVLGPAVAAVSGLGITSWFGFLGWWVSQTDATRARILANPEHLVDMAVDPDESFQRRQVVDAIATYGGEADPSAILGWPDAWEARAEDHPRLVAFARARHQRFVEAAGVDEWQRFVSTVWEGLVWRTAVDVAPFARFAVSVRGGLETPRGHLDESVVPTFRASAAMRAAIAGDAPLPDGPFAGVARAILARLDREALSLDPLGDLHVAHRESPASTRILVFRASKALKRALNPK